MMKISNFFTKEGYFCIGMSFLVWVLSIGFDIGVVGFLLFIFTLYFYRKTDNIIADDSKGVVLCMVDGKVIDVISEKESVRVIVENKILNTHTLYMPDSQKIIKINATFGMALNCDFEKAKEINTTKKIEFENFSIKIIAKLFPQKPKIYPKENEFIQKAKEIGFLYCGFIEIELPKNTTIKVSPNDRVKALENVIGIIDAKK